MGNCPCWTSQTTGWRLWMKESLLGRYSWIWAKPLTKWVTTFYYLKSLNTALVSQLWDGSNRIYAIELKHALFLDHYLILSRCHKAFNKDQFWGPLLFSLYINDLPLCLSTSDAEIYADDTMLWTSDRSIDHIQQNLQVSLNNASSLFKLNKMVPNTKEDETPTHSYTTEIEIC